MDTVRWKNACLTMILLYFIKIEKYKKLFHLILYSGDFYSVYNSLILGHENSLCGYHC